ncbi:MAG: hypothetical protein CSB47_04040 [Proteobacteria bacterium]|nr:MAG: hypothetical protein CSB47_04040 [Pseudomonadota bacterium]
MADGWIQLSNQRYPYRFQHSKRAKYIRLKLAHNGDLCVVVPDGVSLNKARLFAESQAAWLTQKLPQITRRTETITLKPERLELLYLGESWRLFYQTETDAESVELMPDQATLSLHCSGLVDDSVLCHKAIGTWLKAKAEQVIPQRLSELAEQHGFSYRRVSIRGQKTRWGSCSSQKNISLNYKLLFLPKTVADYVLIHELCHTIVMNHSPDFWRLVADCDKNYKVHDKALKQYAKSIPL